MLIGKIITNMYEWCTLVVFRLNLTNFMFLFFFHVYLGDFFFFPRFSLKKRHKKMKLNAKKRGEDELEFLLILRLCRVNLFNALCFEEAFAFCCWIIYDLGWCRWEKRKSGEEKLKLCFHSFPVRLAALLFNSEMNHLSTGGQESWRKLFISFLLGTHQKLREVQKNETFFHADKENIFEFKASVLEFRNSKHFSFWTHVGNFPRCKIFCNDARISLTCWLSPNFGIALFSRKKNSLISILILI